LTLHEGVAMAMADGYALASGTLDVLNVHVAPGLGNAMGMLHDATQFVDLVRALGVHAECAERPADLHQALQAAMQRPGPTLIDVPLEADFPVA
jgi:thiamine pyrophosphate-dependent acetolactate synthase large subunit-like protein